jgi:hypothetical protein
MSTTFGVSFPAAWAIALEADAKKAGINVPELIRRRLKIAEEVQEQALRREEVEYLIREVSTIACFARVTVQQSPEHELMSKRILAGVKERLETIGLSPAPKPVKTS